MNLLQGKNSCLNCLVSVYMNPYDKIFSNGILALSFIIFFLFVEIIVETLLIFQAQKMRRWNQSSKSLPMKIILQSK